MDAPSLLLTGASGYVGSRLLRDLEALGRSVRCLARDPRRLENLVAPTTEVVRGDVLVPGSLERALAGIDTAVYLVHSLDHAGDFAAVDRLAATRFGEAARQSGVRRIVYLGGLGEPGPDLSAHLRSRHEVGEVLRRSGVEVIELRASIVIGCGSLSFEMIRALVERLPVMITPRWVDTPCQPIDADDLVRYLLAAIDLPPGESRRFEIGGAER
ncbi:MAG TPA: NAD(P)H-binding protein, partial [Candidatus Binatia bacterium]|nr:NAD(P)H-binding protein [Candidatus Binatia bacterium]